MNSKYGYTAVLAGVGALMFFAGLSAPDSLRSNLSPGGAAAASAKASAPMAAGASASASAADAATPSASSAASAPAPAASPAAASASASASAPILLESLQIPNPAPAAGQYALQAGQFASEDAAVALGVNLKQQKLPFDKPIKTVDQGGKIWYLVPIGPYASLDEARQARTQIALKINLGGALPAILLPPPPAPAKS
jgi:cell division septation protein DedD